MEIYQMKYENIADRIRRLAAAPKDNSGGNGRDSGSNRTVGLRQVELSRNQNAANGPEGRPRYQ